MLQGVIQDFITGMWGKMGEFGNLITGKFCNLKGRVVIWREMFAVLRDKWYFFGQIQISQNHLTMERSFNDITRKYCIFSRPGYGIGNGWVLKVIKPC